MTRPTAPSTKVVVFDIDDTLYLERDYVRSGFRAVGAWARQALGLSDLADRAWAAFEAGVRGTIFDAVLAQGGVDVTPELIAQCVACYRQHVPEIRLLEDARACLDQLRSEPEVAVAVITDGPLASQHAKARTLRLTTWSQDLIFTEELGPEFAKPHPRAFQLVEQRLGVSRDRCAYVADNPTKDFVVPHQLGWRTIRTRRQHGLHFGAEGGDDIDHEVADLTDLVTLLGRGRP